MTERLIEFVDYCKEFYFGPESIYPTNYTEEQIGAVCIAVSKRKLFYGDSIDREIVREALTLIYGVDL